jgi:hypothetical protein
MNHSERLAWQQIARLVCSGKKGIGGENQSEENKEKNLRSKKMMLNIVF